MRVLFCAFSVIYMYRVWHKSFLRSARDSGLLLAWFSDCLNDRKQRVVSPGVSHSWKMFLAPSYGVYISQLIRFTRVCSNIDGFNNRNLFLAAKLLKQGFRYRKIRKAFSYFYHRHSEATVKYNIGLKGLLQQGISEPIFYNDIVYKFKRIVEKPYFSDQFKKITKRYIKDGYNLDAMLLSACLVLNPITVYRYGFLFNCTTVGQASYSLTALT